MKNKEALDLLEAFNSLSGTIVKVIGEKPINVGFIFTTDNRWKIAKNTRILKGIKEQFDDAKEQLIIQNSGPFVKADQAGYIDFLKEEKELLNKTISEIKLEKLTKDDFEKKDDKGDVKNNVPANVLELLMDYIE